MIDDHRKDMKGAHSNGQSHGGSLKFAGNFLYLDVMFVFDNFIKYFRFNI